MLEVILDIETTGLSTKEKHKIVEIGCVELNNLIPTNKIFNEFDLVRIPRLSVMPVTRKYWDTIIKLSNKQNDF